MFLNKIFRNIPNTLEANHSPASQEVALVNFFILHMIKLRLAAVAGRVQATCVGKRRSP